MGQSSLGFLTLFIPLYKTIKILTIEHEVYLLQCGQFSQRQEALLSLVTDLKASCPENLVFLDLFSGIWETGGKHVVVLFSI